MFKEMKSAMQNVRPWWVLLWGRCIFWIFYIWIFQNTCIFALKMCFLQVSSCLSAVVRLTVSTHIRTHIPSLPDKYRPVMAFFLVDLCTECFPISQQPLMDLFFCLSGPVCCRLGSDATNPALHTCFFTAQGHLQAITCSHHRYQHSSSRKALTQH